MATRTIATKLKIDGEAEFKASLQNVNAELRLHRAELEQVEAQYAGQLNSLDALREREKAQSAAAETAGQKFALFAEMLMKAQAIQADYAAKAEELRQKLEALKNTSGDTTKEQAELTRKLAEAEAKMQQAANTVTAYQTDVNRAAKEQATLERELSDTRRYLEEAEKSANECASSIDGLGKAVKDTGEDAEQMGRKTSGAVEALAGAMTAAGITEKQREMVDAIKACVDASMDFESAMAGIQKVTHGTDAEMDALGAQIQQLSTQMPATQEEIAAVAEASARLGVAQEDLMDFSRVMLELGEVSDLTSDQAATALARFGNIAGTETADFERLGSTVVALGNNFATSESEIVEMASRLASAGTLAGMTEPQIMALAAAMSSVGIQAEAGGTAMTQTLTGMEQAVEQGGAALEIYAQTAGMSAAEFASAWRTDALSAVTAFIHGLSSLDEQGGSATATLDALGLSGVRQSNMLKSLALASETLTGTVETADRAWAENTELAEAAAARYETTAAKMDMLHNAVENVKIAVGDALAPALQDAAEAGTDAFSWAAKFVREHPEVVSALAAVVAALATLAGAVTAYTLVVNVAIPLIHAFSAALTANPLGALAVGLSACVAGVLTLGATLPKATEATEELSDAMEGAGEAVEGAAEGIELLTDAAGEVAPVVEAVGDAVEAAAQRADELIARAKELQKTSLELADAGEDLTKVLKEQSESGSLSLDTALDLTEAGYAAALAIDTETGAVTLDRDAYERLAKAKIDEQIATLQADRQAIMEDLAAEARHVEALARTNYDLAIAKMEVLEADRDRLKSCDTQIAALKAARDSLGNYGDAADTAAKRSAVASSRMQTQAQRDLQSYKDLREELDHRQAVGLIEERAYYEQLAQARDRYLTDEDNVSEYRKVTEQIYKYDKSLADREAALWAEQTDALIDELEDRVEAVTDQQERMRSGLEGYGDLYSVEDGDMTLESIQAQIDAIDRYEEALTGLRERGISGDLMNEVLVMDVDSATQYAQQLLAMSEDQLDEYNALWEEKRRRAGEVSESFFRDQLSALEEEYDAKLGEALDQLTDTSFASGQDTAQGLIDGLASKEDALYQQVQAMAAEVQRIFDSVRIPSAQELGATFAPENFREQTVTARDLRSVGAAVVNGMETQAERPVHVSVTSKLDVDGKTLYRETIDDLRAVDKEVPEVMDDR